MWRNSVLFAQIMPGVDGRVAIALLIFVMHFTWWTFCLFACTAAFFWFIERRGYTMRVAWLRMRRAIIGDLRQKWTEGEFRTRSLPNDMVAP